MTTATVLFTSHFRNKYTIFSANALGRSHRGLLTFSEGVLIMFPIFQNIYTAIIHPLKYSVSQ